MLRFIHFLAFMMARKCAIKRKQAGEHKNKCNQYLFHKSLHRYYRQYMVNSWPMHDPVRALHIVRALY